MDSKVELDHVTQLLTLRSMTEKTGAIHEAQVVQLKGYGTLVFGYTKWECNLDVDRKIVIYKVEKKRRPKNLPKLVALLDKFIHEILFGPDWLLRIEEGNAVLYENKIKNAKGKPTSHPGKGDATSD